MDQYMTVIELFDNRAESLSAANAVFDSTVTELQAKGYTLAHEHDGIIHMISICKCHYHNHAVINGDTCIYLYDNTLYRFQA